MLCAGRFVLVGRKRRREGRFFKTLFEAVGTGAKRQEGDDDEKQEDDEEWEND